MMPEITIGRRKVGGSNPVYFIADISANHDGDIERARALIHLCAEAGADAAKFQNFKADKIVSDHGFRSLGGQQSHQSRWKRSVFEVYQAASLPDDWTPILKTECNKAGIGYFSSPYDFEAVDMLDPYVEVHKIGSGDITWPEMLEKIAGKGKPVMLAAGASDIGDVQRAVDCILAVNSQLILMQCNTNYTASLENFEHIHLNALRALAAMYPDVVLGLSDHTPGHATVLGAVTLGARAIEKHFTDDNTREGPDHPFSMTPETWRQMVDHTRELELALGSPRKFVAQNETETVVIQRRCVRAACDIESGTKITRSHLDVLRPAPLDSIKPYEMPQLLGRMPVRDVKAGEHFTWQMISE
jgi:sialic acid synthase SpsE